MSKKRKNPGVGLASRDGKKTITAREFDRLFDEGSDEIDKFIDWSTAKVEQPPIKKPMTLRVDTDILDGFKSSDTKLGSMRFCAVIKKRARKRSNRRGRFSKLCYGPTLLPKRKPGHPRVKARLVVPYL